MTPTRLALVLTALFCAGCASRNYCLREQKYDHVASIPPISAAPGLNVPSPPTALKVPPLALGAPDEPFGSRVTDPAHPGRTQVECLDEPPPMPPNPESGPTATQ
ncbi:MAG: hypothetical protein P4L83_02305 [Nevskia sp.]|nr:hypothetical protein [Nevskia sp.]